MLHRDLREAWHHMPVHDFLLRVKKLSQTRESALASLLSDGASEWDEHKENTAQLLEVQHYQLELAWVDRTADPDDEQAKRERAQAKRDGVRLSKRPMIPPVALRPKALAELRAKRFEQQVAEHRATFTPVKAATSRSDFEKAYGLDT